ncbi:MAG: pyridoxal phosphate-dependent aminotransferase family protein [Elusimicrobia bacterium]|nr:pyridoxal phosphate-dependent aminotransferase family protein [Elusimicrobiota bacterium]MBK7545583.1 pyridoxal phosphate-dependent aminotransferase family protein [Elusimicrobiota bacterium]MBK7575226.1 pyridoxal phosphate-dependent aminotransferase family protein [Elusimicrobiota bacterium]
MNPSNSTGGRRLFPRYLIQPHKTFFLIPNKTDKVEGTAFEIAEDSLTCRFDETIGLEVGEKIELFQKDTSNPLISGKIVSVRKNGDKIRAGIFFPAGGLFSYFPSFPLENLCDSRNLVRGERKAKEEGLREYERRGFWPGLSEKRFFSRYIWELKKTDSYFFMTPLQSGTGAHVQVNGRDMIMMSSNNYLGLSVHPRVKEAAKKAIDKYGSSPSASSLLGGTLDIHLELEDSLARFKGTEAACVFSAGYTTNLTTLLTILAKGDAVFFDDKNHASLMDGVRLSGADARAYSHKNTSDLDSKLSRTKNKNKLVVTDTVFSMDGDFAPLPEIYRTAKRHGAALMVDEAHATGVFGPNGKGLLEHFHMEGKPELVMGTLSKALSGVGGFIAGSKELIRILKHTARAFVFSAAIPPSVCAAILECLKLIEEEPERRKKLWANTKKMREGLRSLGFNTGESQSPIIPVIFPKEEHTIWMTRGLREAGIYVTPAVYPAVKKNATRVRTTIMATHSDSDIDKALETFKNVRSMMP